MNRLLVAALCGAMNSPVVVAEEFSVGASLTDAEVLFSLKEFCSELDAAKERTDCQSMIRELKVIGKKPAIEKAKRTILLMKKYDVCNEKLMKESGLSHKECWQFMTAKAPHCEKLYLHNGKRNLGYLFDFAQCVKPPRSCNKFNTSADPAWKEHCAELAWDGQG